MSNISIAKKIGRESTLFVLNFASAFFINWWIMSPKSGELTEEQKARYKFPKELLKGMDYADARANAYKDCQSKIQKLAVIYPRLNQTEEMKSCVDEKTKEYQKPDLEEQYTKELGVFASQRLKASERAKQIWWRGVFPSIPFTWLPYFSFDLGYYNKQHKTTTLLIFSIVYTVLMDLSLITLLAAARVDSVGENITFSAIYGLIGAGLSALLHETIY